MSKQMMYESQKATIPTSLQPTQEWFASIITNRMVENDKINPIAPSGMTIAEEAARYIVPSPTLRPHQRIQIYNQQYWWRLLNSLHDHFPFVTRLFGYHAFNEEIGIPYLMQYPPHHWSLNLLGDRLTKWIGDTYQAADRSLVLNAAQLDWAFTDSFLTAQIPTLELADIVKDDPEKLLSSTFSLQPHVQLFKWDYDFLTFRDAFLKQNVDYWTNNDFPQLLKERTYFFVLYRTLKNNIIWKEITIGEYTLLSLLKKGSSIESACERLEEDAVLYEQAVTNLQNWFQDWTSRRWLVLESV